jgi:AraC-like DNA-binding protein
MSPDHHPAIDQQEAEMLNTSVNVAALGQKENVLVAILLEDALRLLELDRAGARQRIEDARALVHRDEDGYRAKNGVLAEWQLQRAEAFILDHLDSRLRIGSVAKTVNLSPSYFSRAFKATKGIAYSDFVLMSRMALAKRLLLTTQLPIAQIALNCGMADQSHLTRAFSRAVGASPRAWRCRRLADLRNDHRDAA